jgi:hypothetical protein
VPEPSALSFDEAVEILSPALPDDSLVLVGGQALNYWLAYYRKRDGRLKRHRGVTSTDVDFLGSPASIEKLARAIRGRLKHEGERSATIAVVRFTDSRGTERVIDFLRTVHGLKEARIRATAIPVDTVGGELKLMHPVLCLESRVHNVHDLEQYRTPRALRQLAAAIGVTRAYVVERCDRGDLRSARRAISIIGKLARSNAGRAVLIAHELDALDAIPEDARLGEKFLSEDLPRIRQRAGRK